MRACNKQRGVKQLCLFSLLEQPVASPPRWPDCSGIRSNMPSSSVFPSTSSSSLCEDVLNLFSTKVLHFNEHFYLGWSKQQMLAVKSGRVEDNKIAFFFFFITWTHEGVCEALRCWSGQVEKVEICLKARAWCCLLLFIESRPSHKICWALKVPLRPPVLNYLTALLGKAPVRIHLNTSFLRNKLHESDVLFK